LLKLIGVTTFLLLGTLAELIRSEFHPDDEMPPWHFEKAFLFGESLNANQPQLDDGIFVFFIRPDMKSDNP